MRPAAALALIALAAAPARADVDYQPPPPYPVQLQLASDQPELKLQITRTDGSLVCIEPCRSTVLIKEYERFRIRLLDPTPGLALVFDEIPPFALPPDHPKVGISIQVGRPARRLAAAFTLGGGGLLAVLGLLTGAGSAGYLALHQSCVNGSCASTLADPTPARTARTVGFTVAGVGALAAALGAALLAVSPAPRATFASNL